MIGVGRPVIDAEGARFAGSFATPQGNWLAATDARLLAIFRRLNDRAWARWWKGATVTPLLPAGNPPPSAADATRGRLF